MTARLAKEIAEHIEEATNASRNGARDTSFFELKVAGVKATLYAAEQQRIANVIELAGPGQDRTAHGALWEPVGESWDLHLSLRPEIREGLGLA